MSKKKGTVKKPKDLLVQKSLVLAMSAEMIALRGNFDHLLREFEALAASMNVNLTG